MEKLLTVFTPTYNRAHTLVRTYKSLCDQTCKDFNWLIIDDGSKDNTKELVDQWIEENLIPIQYIYKENGGLYTGYNTAFANITTELNVCVDSDDYMPEGAVQLITETWKSKGGKDYAGITGLDFDVRTKEPIGGYFTTNSPSINVFDLKHVGDVKHVLRTDLMKTVSPMTGFPGEKDFNPYYMMMQVLDKYPVLLLNENLCWVEYQIGIDSMSQGIFKQYVRSPRSYAKYRIMEMKMDHCSFSRKVQLCIHYVSSCILSKDKDWLKKSPEKFLTLLVAPFGYLLTFYIKKKAKQ